MNEGQEVASGLVIPSRHAAMLFDSIDEPLDQVSSLVQVVVKNSRLLSVHLGRDHRLGPFGFDRLDQRITIVCLVRDDRRRRVTLQERFGLSDIRLLSGSQADFHGQAQTTYGQVDFRGKTTSGSAQCFLFRSSFWTPFFAPAAC